MMQEIYGLIMVNTGIHPLYFLDEMTFLEISSVVDAITDRNKSRWEQTRVLATNIVNCFTSKFIPASELMPFVWDKPEAIKFEKPDMDPERIAKMEAIVNKMQVSSIKTQD